MGELTRRDFLIAGAAGLDLVGSFPLSRLFSGHHYAVLRKRG